MRYNNVGGQWTQLLFLYVDVVHCTLSLHLYCIVVYISGRCCCVMSCTCSAHAKCIILLTVSFFSSIYSGIIVVIKSDVFASYLRN